MPKKVSFNIFSLLISKVFSLILVLIGYYYLFRYLGPYGMGQYQFVLSYVMLFSIVVDFGIQQLVIKKVSEDKSLAKKYLGNFFAVEFLLAFVIYIILSGVALLNGYEPVVVNAIIVVGLGMLLTALAIPYKAIISSYEDMHVIAVMNFVDSVVNFSVMILAVLFHKYIVFLAIVQVIMGIIHLLVYRRIIKRYVPEPELLKSLSVLDFDLVKNMFKLALPFGMLVGFSIIYNRIDVVIISHLKGYEQNGFYSAAYKFFDSLVFVPAIFSSSLYPFFSSQIKLGNLDGVKAALENYSKYLIMLAIPIAFGGAILAKQLIVIWGEEFLPGYVALQVLVFAVAAVFVYAAVNSIMINQLTRYAVYITFINIVINIVGNILLVPRFGIRAAAAMTVVSEVFQASMYLYFVKSKIINFHFFKFFTKPVIAASIMALCVYPLRAKTLFITIPLGVAVYSVLIILMRHVKREDFVALKSIVRREA